MTSELKSIFKAYDVRGVYPGELNEDVARRVGAAFARFVESDRVVVGRDMRTSSPALANAFAEGVTAEGGSVVDVGEVSTDALYFASGKLDLPGVMFTASHNPARYNGMKMCKAKAVPIGSDSGMNEIRATAEALDPPQATPRVEEADILSNYADHCRSFVDAGTLRPLKVAIDAGNGMAGKTVPIVFDPLPFEVSPLYFDLDGSFPNHPANPIEEANLADLQKLVLEQGCDVGIGDGGSDSVEEVPRRKDHLQPDLFLGRPRGDRRERRDAHSDARRSLVH